MLCLRLLSCLASCEPWISKKLFSLVVMLKTSSVNVLVETIAFEKVERKSIYFGKTSRKLHERANKDYKDARDSSEKTQMVRNWVSSHAEVTENVPNAFLKSVVHILFFESEMSLILRICHVKFCCCVVPEAHPCRALHALFPEQNSFFVCCSYINHLCSLSCIEICVLIPNSPTRASYCMVCS